ncbi:DUF6331 family protein [Chitinophagaceae bacterium MMS25-I14]
MTHKGDISIGQDQWIQWVDFDTHSDDLFGIDGLLQPLWPFIERLETDCNAWCCGIEAFALWPEDIRKAAASFDKQQLLEDFIHLRNEINASNRSIVISSLLNNLFDKSVFIKLLDHIIQQLEM